METRREFFTLASRQGSNIADLCRRFGISRQTGYKWLARGKIVGETFADRSHRPVHSPRRTPEDVEAKVVAVRRAHPSWGARKLIDWLKASGEEDLPSASTVTEILRRNGCLAQAPSVTCDNPLQLALAACRGAGASEAASRSLAAATLSAERHGKASVGFAHLVDYLDAFASGRIAGDAAPELSSPARAVIACDARGGIAQLGFDLAFDDLRARCAALGVVIFAQQNSYTSGELGYYVRRLAETGLVALAATNGPALMTPPGGAAPVYCTNPIAFAAPVANGPPLVIDQASSSTAFVNVRDRAERGEALPPGWAIDAEGRETKDARAAMRGALLTFGGARGANIALMVEVLAAGLTGANWSLDAPSFTEGTKTPGAGLFVVAIAPDVLAPDFAARLESQLARLASLGVHIPGRRGERAERIELPAPLLARIQAYAAPPSV